MVDPIVAALVASPDDPQVRLVYADWLEGRGYPRHAKVIRLCVEAERLGGFPEPAFGAARGLRIQTAAERERVEEIRGEILARGREDGEGNDDGDRDGADDRDGGDDNGRDGGRRDGDARDGRDGHDDHDDHDDDRRDGHDGNATGAADPWPQVEGLRWSGDLALGGLPSGLHVESWAAFERVADRLAEVAPIRYLAFDRLDVRVARALVGSGWLARLLHLSLHGAHVTRSALKLLVASEDARRLRSIDLSLARLEDGGARVLAEAPALAGLEALFVYGDRLGDRGGMAIARSPHLQGLRALNLEMNYLGAGSAREFLTPDRFPHMVYLNLFDNEGLEDGGHVEPLRARWGDLIEI